MKPYNVEIFDSSMNYVANTVVDEIKYKSDYLDPEKWKVNLLGISNSHVNDYIHIQRDDEDYIGIITQLEEKAEGVLTISIGEIPSLFDIDIMVDVSDMSYSLENYIKKWLEALFVNGDTSMAMPLDITVSSTTNNWELEYDIKNEPREGETEPPVLVAEMNLFDDIILPAFLQYQIRLKYSIDLNNKTINVDIGKNTSEAITIEADLPNVLNKKVVIKQARNQINKVIVYDTNNYNNSITYYLHSDDSFDTSDTDRQLPVNYKLLEAHEEEEEGVITKTFAEAAYEKAEATFTKNKYTNLIEVELLMDDNLINPHLLEVGQEVSVISNNVAHTSILTGREIGKTTTLVFGTVRLELTKIMKGRA